MGLVYVILLSAAQHLLYLACNLAATTWCAAALPAATCCRPPGPLRLPATLRPCHAPLPACGQPCRPPRSRRLLRMPPPENVATGIMASQKSGPVSVAGAPARARLSWVPQPSPQEVSVCCPAPPPGPTGSRTQPSAVP